MSRSHFPRRMRLVEPRRRPAQAQLPELPPVGPARVDCACLGITILHDPAAAAACAGCRVARS